MKPSTSSIRLRYSHNKDITTTGAVSKHQAKPDVLKSSQRNKNVHQEKQQVLSSDIVVVADQRNDEPIEVARKRNSDLSAAREGTQDRKKPIMSSMQQRNGRSNSPMSEAGKAVNDFFVASFHAMTEEKQQEQLGELPPKDTTRNESTPDSASSIDNASSYAWNEMGKAVTNFVASVTNSNEEQQPASAEVAPPPVLISVRANELSLVTKLTEDDFFNRYHAEAANNPSSASAHPQYIGPTLSLISASEMPVKETQALGGPKYYIATIMKAGQARVIHEAMPIDAVDFQMVAEEKGYEILEYELVRNKEDDAPPVSVLSPAASGRDEDTSPAAGQFECDLLCMNDDYDETICTMDDFDDLTFLTGLTDDSYSFDATNSTDSASVSSSVYRIEERLRRKRRNDKKRRSKAASRKASGKIDAADGTIILRYKAKKVDTISAKDGASGFSKNESLNNKDATSTASTPIVNNTSPEAPLDTDKQGANKRRGSTMSVRAKKVLDKAKLKTAMKEVILKQAAAADKDEIAKQKALGSVEAEKEAASVEAEAKAAREEVRHVVEGLQGELKEADASAREEHPQKLKVKQAIESAKRKAKMKVAMKYASKKRTAADAKREVAKQKALEQTFAEQDAARAQVEITTARTEAKNALEELKEDKARILTHEEHQQQEQTSVSTTKKFVRGRSEIIKKSLVAKKFGRGRTFG